VSAPRWRGQKLFFLCAFLVTITFTTASAPAVLNSSPQKEIVSALNKVKATAGITPYGGQQQVDVGAASESSDTGENLVAVCSFFAFGELGFLPEEVYFLTGKIGDGAGSIYIYQFSSEDEAATAFQRSSASALSSLPTS